MTVYIVPTANGAENASYVQRTTLDGVPYLLTFEWNGREGRWYLSVADVDGELILASRKIVCNWPLLDGWSDERRPAGELVAWDLSGAGLDPALDDLGTRVRLTYYDAAEMAARAEAV